MLSLAEWRQLKINEHEIYLDKLAMCEKMYALSVNSGEKKNKKILEMFVVVFGSNLLI